MITLIFFLSVFRDWRQRHVAPPQSPGFTFLAGADLGWWHRLAHCGVINTDHDQGPDPGHQGKNSSSIPFIWLLPWGNVLVKCFIQPFLQQLGLANCRRNQLVSRLHCWWNAPVLPLLLSSSPSCCCNVKLAASHQMLPIVSPLVY